MKDDSFMWFAFAGLAFAVLTAVVLMVGNWEAAAIAGCSRRARMRQAATHPGRIEADCRMPQNRSCDRNRPDCGNP
jgi:hypothetical protein